MNQILKDFEKMKRIAYGYAKKQEWDKALKTIFFASGFMFNMNQILYDADLEKLLEDIARENVILSRKKEKKENTLLYYDSFGQAKRGLTQIYLKGLSKLGFHILYVTFQIYDRVKQDVLPYVKEEDMYFVSNDTPLNQMKELVEIVEESGAERIFMYLMPDDVVAVGAFSLFAGQIKRYQINLTDHAFWLGKNISDVVMNFRKFGTKVCSQYRGIEKGKNVYLPYYPGNVSTEYLGLDFVDNSKPFMFSGGNLYKTHSKDGIFYKLIRQMLEAYDVNFAYFGDGDAKEMMRLCKEYPGRIIFSRERTDFFEVLKRSTVYLSTYPYNGGLMTQYALLAKKVPVTLCCDGIEPELTINHENTFWNLNSVEEVLEEIGRLLKDADYRRKQESRLEEFIIDEEQFAIELASILKENVCLRDVEDQKVDMNGFVEHPRWYYQGLRYNRLFFRRDGFFFLHFFPVRYMTGAVGRILERIYNGK
ncbi:MAG: hypothetical protein J6A75_09050 [Lachnospiraceae bacterium]|nr:hypothetical protein [Lachnospiraceae bacterium]